MKNLFKRIKTILAMNKLHKVISNLDEATQEEIATQDNAVMVVALVEGWNESSNSHWELDKDKSFPREGVNCSECKKPVVMSNGMFEAFSKNKTAKATCISCILKVIEKEKAELGDKVEFKFKKVN